jgi:hypothetical protein
MGTKAHTFTLSKYVSDRIDTLDRGRKSEWVNRVLHEHIWRESSPKICLICDQPALGRYKYCYEHNHLTSKLMTKTILKEETPPVGGKEE